MCVGPLVDNNPTVRPPAPQKKLGFAERIKKRFADIRISRIREEAEGNIVRRLADAPTIVRAQRGEQRGASSLRNPNTIIRR